MTAGVGNGKGGRKAGRAETSDDCFMQGGRELTAPVGHGWQHTGFSSAILLARPCSHPQPIFRRRALAWRLSTDIVVFCPSTLACAWPV